MKFKISLIGLLVALGAQAQTPTTIDLRGGQTVFEYTGQVTNIGTASVQVGYLNYVKGFNNVFITAPQDESTAEFTFYTSVTTTRNVLNGSMRLVDREGTSTIYLAKGPADFANLDSFRAGTPIQTSTIRQQVLVDTISIGFTVSNFNVIDTATSFTLGGTSYQLGAPGQTLRTSLTGHLTTTSSPSGYFGGYAVGTNDSVPFMSVTPNPARPVDSTGLVQVTLKWDAPGVSQVEIHVGAPDGILLARGEPSGTATTGSGSPTGRSFSCRTFLAANLRQRPTHLRKSQSLYAEHKRRLAEVIGLRPRTFNRCTLVPWRKPSNRSTHPPGIPLSKS